MGSVFASLAVEGAPSEWLDEVWTRETSKPEHVIPDAEGFPVPSPNVPPAYGETLDAFPEEVTEASVVAASLDPDGRLTRALLVAARANPAPLLRPMADNAEIRRAVKMAAIYDYYMARRATEAKSGKVRAGVLRIVQQVQPDDVDRAARAALTLSKLAQTMFSALRSERSLIGLIARAERGLA